MFENTRTLFIEVSKDGKNLEFSKLLPSINKFFEDKINASWQDKPEYSIENIDVNIILYGDILKYPFIDLQKILSNINRQRHINYMNLHLYLFFNSDLDTLPEKYLYLFGEYEVSLIFKYPGHHKLNSNGNSKFNEVSFNELLKNLSKLYINYSLYMTIDKSNIEKFVFNLKYISRNMKNCSSLFLNPLSESIPEELKVSAKEYLEGVINPYFDCLNQSAQNTSEALTIPIPQINSKVDLYLQQLTDFSYDTLENNKGFYNVKFSGNGIYNEVILVDGSLKYHKDDSSIFSNNFIINTLKSEVKNTCNELQKRSCDYCLARSICVYGNDRLTKNADIKDFSCELNIAFKNLLLDKDEPIISYLNYNFRKKGYYKLASNAFYKVNDFTYPGSLWRLIKNNKIKLEPDLNYSYNGNLAKDTGYSASFLLKPGN